MKKILVCAPHTDDMEFGCGGTIKMLSETDAEISLLVFSTCEQSLPKKFSVQDIKQEQASASKILGVKRKNLQR